MHEFGVHSEVGRLRTVLVCRPGLAHQRLTPGNAAEFLFDDVLWVQEARNDHYDFTLKMSERGVEVLDLHDLLAQTLAKQGYDLRITRDLDVSKAYLRDRYSESPDARFGIIASSRDKDLVRFGVMNDFQSTKIMRYGPWYGDGESVPGNRSCRLLRDCVTEFGAQGLELDAALLAWGTDFLLADGRWAIEGARGYKRGGPKVRNPWQLRANAYRVLLTRARDATVLFVPRLSELDATFDYLQGSGFRLLDIN
jgi:hypothetical protein